MAENGGGGGLGSPKQCLTLGQRPELSPALLPSRPSYRGGGGCACGRTRVRRRAVLGSAGGADDGSWSRRPEGRGRGRRTRMRSSCPPWRGRPGAERPDSDFHRHRRAVIDSDGMAPERFRPGQLEQVVLKRPARWTVLCACMAASESSLIVVKEHEARAGARRRAALLSPCKQ